jgi:FMN phosphatase YigB (HAD superfamily)
MKKDLVLFDIGAVLLKINFDKFYRSGAASAGISASEFKHAYAGSGLEELFLEGSISKQSFLASLSKLAKCDTATAESIYSQVWERPADYVVGVKKQLFLSGNAVGVFSNIPEMGVQFLEEHYPDVVNVFDPSFPKIFSYKAGRIKPDPAIYGELDRSRFENVVFVDDKPGYLQPAVELGWNGILFTPYIDKSEALRQTQATHDGSANYTVVDSERELIPALKRYGIRC